MLCTKMKVLGFYGNRYYARAMLKVQFGSFEIVLDHLFVRSRIDDLNDILPGFLCFEDFCFSRILDFSASRIICA